MTERQSISFSEYRKHHKEKKDQARELYFNFVDQKEICKKLGLKRETLKNWVNDSKRYKNSGWSKLRTDLVYAALKSSFEQRGFVISKMWSASLPWIYNSIIHHINGKKILSLPEMLIVSNLLSSLDKVFRLDTGQSTENIDVKKLEPLSLTEIKKILESDYFIDAKDKNKPIDISDKNQQAELSLEYKNPVDPMINNL